MYKYTYLPKAVGQAVVADVEFGPEGFIIVRSKLDRLNLFVDAGIVKCEAYSPAVPITTNTTKKRRGRKPKDQSSAEVTTSEVKKVESNLPPLEDMDPVSKLLMST